MKTNRRREPDPTCGERRGEVFDADHLRRYTLGDTALEMELLGLFRAQARLQLDLISAAACAGDFSASVHALKGAALAMGATDIAKTTVDLEAVDFEADPAKRQRLVERLRIQVAAAEAAIARKAG
jgi:HPt (histidine-containing phosphotransfer) domain-containing protein